MVAPRSRGSKGEVFLNMIHSQLSITTKIIANYRCEGNNYCTNQESSRLFFTMYELDERLFATKSPSLSR